MKLSTTMSILMLIEKSENVPVSSVNLAADVTVHENEHTMCDEYDIPSDFACAELRDFTVCTRKCSYNPALVEKRRCECYTTYFGTMRVYTPDKCQWHDFGLECFDEPPIGLQLDTQAAEGNSLELEETETKTAEASTTSAFATTTSTVTTTSTTTTTQQTTTKSPNNATSQKVTEKSETKSQSVMQTTVQSGDHSTQVTVFRQGKKSDTERLTDLMRGLRSFDKLTFMSVEDGILGSSSGNSNSI